MAITAEFAADFSQFNTEVKKAEKELALFEGQTLSTGQAIDGMGTVSAGAAPKASALSASMKSIGLVASSAGLGVAGLGTSLTGLATATATAVAGLGAIGTAGAVLAAGISGWGIGRKIAEQLNSDVWIGNATAAILGWGTTWKETAGAVADTLAKASEVSGKSITNMKDAVRILDDQRKALKEWETATQAVAIAAQDHQRVLDTLNGTVVEAARFALEQGVAQDKVATAYELTAPQIAAVVAMMKQEKEAAKARADQIAEWTAKQKAEWDAAFAIRDRLFGTDAIKKADDYAKAIGLLGGSIDSLTNDQLAELEQAMVAGIDALARSGQLTNEQSSAFAALAAQANIALEALKPLVTTTEDLVKAQWDYVTALDEEARAARAAADEQNKKQDAADASKPSRPAGGGLLPNAIAGRNGVAMDMYGRPTTIGGALTNLPILNININSPLGTPDQIASAVGGAVTGSYSSGGKRLPV
jgi:hypothetical protein